MIENQFKEVRDAWSKSATYWEKHRDVIRSMFSPVTRALVEAAGVQAGQNVLDVAGGAGEPSLTLARLVGPSGRVAYTDFVQEMVEAAERQARRSHIENISFHQAPAESLPFPDHCFDAAVCRFGAMFFFDPDLACREMARVVKPGGKLAFAVWDRRESNPFFGIVADAISKFIEPAPEEPDAPGAFRYIEPGSFAAVLDKAGLTAVTEYTLRFSIEAPISLDMFWQTRVELSESMRDKVARLSAGQIEQARHSAETSAAPYFAGDAMSIPAQAIIVSAVAS